MSTSIGYSFAMSGVTRNPNTFRSPNTAPSKLGGGYPGYQPQLLGGGAGVDGGSGMEGGGDRSTERFVLREAWNGQQAAPVLNNYGARITPFRRVNNAGDYLSRKYYTSGGSDQVQGRIHISVFGQSWKGLAGAVQAKPDNTGIPSATCNTKYVYDGSDYTTFKKQQAINRTYNDYSFGGNDYSGSQSAWRRAHHF